MKNKKLFFERKYLSHKDMILSRDGEEDPSPGFVWKRPGLPYLKKRTRSGRSASESSRRTLCLSIAFLQYEEK